MAAVDWLATFCDARAYPHVLAHLIRDRSPEYDALLSADHPAASHKKRKELEPALGYADSDGEMLNDRSRDFLMRYMLHDLALYLAENPMPRDKNVAFVERHAAMKLACKDNGEPLKIKAAVAGSEDRAAAAVNTVRLCLAEPGRLFQ